MPLFKKKSKIEKPEEKKNKKAPLEDNSTQKVIKKRKKIGLRQKKQKNKKIKEENKKSEEKDTIEADILPIEEEIEQKEEKKPFTTKKKKTIIKKDMKDKPVFLEDTGEKIGIVFDMIYDQEKSLLGYKIKDSKSDAILSFPLEQFDFNKEGLIFVPGWYNNSLKTIEKLEFKDKISPDLTALLSDDAVTNEELYEIFVKHDDEMVDYIDDAIALKEMLKNRLDVLEKQRIALKDDLMDLTEKRLIKDIDRRKFSEDVINHRRKVNVLDINIDKCKQLIKRLDNTSFGKLGKRNENNSQNHKNPKIEKNLYERILKTEKPVINTIVSQEKNEQTGIYKDKYFALKNQYQQLEEEYQELKLAVDKLLNKEQI